MYPLFKDERGSFQELAHSNDVIFGQLSLLTIEPQSIRGGHYHTRKGEWFCCIHGECEMVLRNATDGSLRTVSLNDATKDFVKVDVNEIHSIKNLSELEVCEVLIIASEVFNANDTDTFEVGK